MTQTDNATKVSERIEGYVLGHFATNCYLVRDPGSDGCWIIDASWGAGDMLPRAQELGLRPEKLLLTHAHTDHIAGIPEIKATLPDLPVAIHPIERDWLGDPQKNLSAGLGRDPVSLPDPDEILEDGQTLTLGDSEWLVMHTPGHSPGSVSLYCAEIGAVIAGDTLFAGSIGRYDFPTSDGDTLFASIREKLYTLPDDTIVLPGHGGVTTIGHEKASNPFVRPL